ncbi:hypothetical protein CYLTODRAFT_443503 [Cylindrobasidium torrendii FP15055 ss-10]|uniref:Uncharacterized protein n=1 Tax=Cylindrobasidium torrendii FP15055 ss-10 TaxID=1314674 RepID=A0A0D7BDF8_9AGAR|nr:hypothetical protein CYLTODRAFT_443503 [Cylindrobasidium torrendii FP15055 ss-10]
MPPKRTADALDSDSEAHVKYKATSKGTDRPPPTKKARKAPAPKAMPTPKAKAKAKAKAKEAPSPVVVDNANESPEEEAVPTRPSGSFDIYLMELPFLQEILMPPKASAPDYLTLYKDLVIRQGKKDRSGQVNFGDDNGVMRVNAPGFEDPMEDDAYDLTLSDVKVVDEAFFTEDEENTFFPEPPKTDGSGMIVASLDIESHCGVASASGEVKMMTTPSANMFFGVMNMRVSYSGMYSRKGHGYGTDETYAFWALKSKEGDEMRGFDEFHEF